MLRALVVLISCWIPVQAFAQFFPPIKQKIRTTNMGLFKEIAFKNSYLLNVDIGQEYRIRTWFSFGANVNVYKFTNDKDYSTIGLGLQPVTRLFFFSSPRFEIFGETRGGIVFMIPQYPDRSVNFTFVSSLGADLYIFRRGFLRISGGYHHFSNGKRYSDLRNPSWDGLGLNIAYAKLLY